MRWIVRIYCSILTFGSGCDVNLVLILGVISEKKTGRFELRESKTQVVRDWDWWQ
jgi:hypothetical protein